MRKYTLLILLVHLNLFLFAQVRSDRDHEHFFSRNDLVFNDLSTKWEEGAFLGNGSLGVMVYREDANSIRFDLGRTDVVDHRPGINPSLGRCRLPIGRFVLHTKGNITKIDLRLDLWNAELKGKISTDKGEIELQSLVAATSEIILINTKGTQKETDYELLWKPEKSESPARSRDTVTKYDPNPNFIISKENDINFNYQRLLVGGSYTTAWKETNINEQRSLYITVANSYPADVSKNTAKQTITSALAEKQVDLINNHQQWWHKFYQKSFISIPDSRLESFWWIQQYKLGSATRENAIPIDLMGPWYRNSPWPKYWWNLNIQLTYYPVFSSNHLDLAKPLYKMINDNLGNLSKNVPEPYQYNAASLGRSGPYDMTSSTKARKDNDSTGNSSASLETGNLTWLLHVYWQGYEYSMDKTIMKNIYPVLTKSINYYLDIMNKGTDGKYHLPYTYSPEYPKGITRDANYDLSLFKWGCKTLLYINEQLKLNDPLAQKWKDVVANLVPYPKDENGLRVGKDASFTISHRHYSHMLMIYPINEMNWDNQQDRALIRKSLSQWENNNSAWRGYSYSGAGSIYAMMGEGAKTAGLLNDMIDKGRFAIKPNTMYLEAGPVIETPLSAVNTVNEMLLQSWNGAIRVFPAVPDSWKDASFDKLLAKGAFEVSAQRKNDKTQFIRIKSLAGMPCVLKSDLSSGVQQKGSRKFNVLNKGKDLISIDLKKGEEIVLFSKEYKGDFAIRPVQSNTGKYNAWGLNK